MERFSTKCEVLRCFPITVQRAMCSLLDYYVRVARRWRARGGGGGSRKQRKKGKGKKKEEAAVELFV
jgi:hypothetical protein